VTLLAKAVKQASASGRHGSRVCSAPAQTSVCAAALRPGHAGARCAGYLTLPGMPRK
jgi:hypothetical protein